MAPVTKSRVSTHLVKDEDRVCPENYKLYVPIGLTLPGAIPNLRPAVSRPLLRPLAARPWFRFPSCMSLVSRRLLTRLALACLLAAGGAAHAQGTAQAATVTPPPGTMTGAYGQSLQQQAAAPEKPSTATQPAQAKAPAQDAVTRFLSERGLLNSVEQAGSSRLLASVRDTASDLVLSAMRCLAYRSLSAVMILGRPPLRPLARAATNPSFTLWRMMLRSISAKAA